MTSMKVRKLLGEWGGVFGLLMAGTFIAGCQTAPDPRFAIIPGVGGSPTVAPNSTVAVNNTTPPPVVSAPSPRASLLDWIRVGDTLVVTFSDLPGNPQPPIEDRVRDDGTIKLIQDLSFVAAGKTRSELEEEIRTNYVPRYFKTMSVSVKKKDQTEFYYVDGEVKRPDRQVYISRLTVTKAIASASGFTDFARKTNIELTRVNGQKIKVNFNKALRDPSQDPEVYPGDRIYVERRNPFW
jgi:protein involved in polysaccharide export with SLBB domain